MGPPDWSGAGQHWRPLVEGTEVAYSAHFVLAGQPHAPAGPAARPPPAGLGGSSVHALVQRASSAAASSALPVGALAVAQEHERRPIQLQLYTQPFAKGALRQAFYAR